MSKSRGRRLYWWEIAMFTACLLVTAARLPVRTDAMAPPPEPMPLAYAYVPSPNFDDRPPSAEISCIVLHATVEPTTEATMHIFLDPSRRVSAHFVVGR